MLGIFAALGAASSWTYACFLWRQQTKYFSAIHINLIKNVIAFVIFSPIIITFDFKSNVKEIFILLISGYIGIALGDSFYITSLKKLGTRSTLTVESLSPLIATILGSFLLNEMLPIKVWFGIIIVSISLVGVAFQNTQLKTAEGYKHIDKYGFVFAFCSVLCAVIAAILSRLVLKNSILNPFQTTEIRLLGALMALLPFLRVDLSNKLQSLSLKNRFRLLIATILGTNIGILLQQYVFQILPVGVGWTLLSTSPLFSLFFLKAEGEKLNSKSLVLTATTILGVAVAFF